MKSSNQSWKLLTMPFGRSLDDALRQQHHAAQYIALTGRHLIPQKADDSNTNMELNPETGMLIGNPLTTGIKVGLRLNDLALVFIDKDDNVVKTVLLDGKTKEQGFSLLKNTLKSLGTDTSALKNELHYEIPLHALDKGAAFSVSDKKCFNENLLYRVNARLVLQQVVSGLKNAELVKIWPHHFDTGSFVSFSNDETGNISQTIGLGLAIPDGMVNEPYFYLSFWDADPKNIPGNFTALKAGKWMMPQWNGAVLPLSEILQEASATGQHLRVKTFFDEAVVAVIQHLKKKN